MCGITGIISFDRKDVKYDLQESLYHLQHRGQDAFGFSIIDNEKIKIVKDKGLIKPIINNLQINRGIGHVRYPTKGSNTINEAQPLYYSGKYHNISLVHNGQIWKSEHLLNYLDKNGIKIDEKITSDSAILLSLLGYHLNCFKEINNEIIKNIILILYTILEGSFNVICLIEGFGLICFKDQNSIRPLILGKKDNNYLISSESISLTSLDYSIIDDIYNNEIHIFTERYDKIALDTEYKLKPCIFEWIYLAREESIMYGVNIYESRFKMGEYLSHKIRKNISKTNLDKIDYIVPIPDTSKPCALSISKNLKIPYSESITKNRYVNRTFIMDTQDKRRKNIKRKLNVIEHLIENKNIMIVDDSIVRGNTMKHIVNLLKKHKAKKIYIISCCPEIINENKYGIDIPYKSELICYNKNIKEIFDVEDIIFQNLDDLKSSVKYFNSDIKDFEDSIFMK